LHPTLSAAALIVRRIIRWKLMVLDQRRQCDAKDNR
jgi:hypothetical protein